MKIKLFKRFWWAGLRGFGASITLGICRFWRKDSNWTIYPTMRYIGISIGTHFRLGRTTIGRRVYHWCGPITLWQDVLSR